VRHGRGRVAARDLVREDEVGDGGAEREVVGRYRRLDVEGLVREEPAHESRSRERAVGPRDVEREPRNNVAERRDGRREARDDPQGLADDVRAGPLEREERRDFRRRRIDRDDAP